ncbi:MAG: hypothetical protein ACJ8AI_29220 [Rhodopila sp.]
MLCYVLWPSIPVVLARRFPAVYQFLLHKWYFDELYDLLFVRPMVRWSAWLWNTADRKVIDGMPNGVAAMTVDLGRRAMRLQSGSVSAYAFATVIGLVTLMTLVLVLGAMS